LYKIVANTDFIGKKIIFLPSCHSTNSIALEYPDVIADGTVIITDYQTGGRGRRGNAWESAAGLNLTFSILLRPILPQEVEIFDFSVVTSLALCKTLTFFLPNKDFKIKWPNDIYVNNKKIAGILIENVWQGKKLTKTVIGIGLNVNQTEFSNIGAISMRKLSEIFIEKEIILQKYFEYFEYFFMLLQQGFAKFLRNEYQNLLFAKNEVRLFQIFGETLQAKILSVFPDGKISIEIVSENRVISLDLNELNFIL